MNPSKKTRKKRFKAACHAMQGLLSQHVMYQESDTAQNDFLVEPAYPADYVAGIKPNAIPQLVRDAFTIADQMLNWEHTAPKSQMPQ